MIKYTTEELEILRNHKGHVVDRWHQLPNTVIYNPKTEYKIENSLFKCLPRNRFYDVDVLLKDYEKGLK